MAKYRQALILYNIKEREFLIAQMTADVLREQGLADEVIVGQVYEVIYHIYDYEPELVISCLPRDDYSTAMFTMVKLVHRCAWVSIPPEGFMALETGKMKQVTGFNRQPKELVDRVMFWGSGLAKAAGQLMLENGKISSGERIGIFGYLPYEDGVIRKYREETEQVRQIKKRTGEYRRTVMAVTARMAIPVPLQEFEKLYDPNDREQNERVRKRHNSNEYFADWYIQLLKKVAEQNEDILFLIKLHPRDIRTMHAQDLQKTRFDELKSVPNICLIDEPVQISTYFDCIDLLIHYGSTTAMEAYIYGIPTIGIMNDHPDTQYDSLGRGNFYADRRFDVGRAAEVSACVRQGLSFDGNEETAKALKRYMNYREGEPYQPSLLLAEQIRKLPEPQLLSTGDPEVRTAL